MHRSALGLVALGASGALLLTGCAGGSNTEVGADGAATSFTFTYPQANDSEDFYEQTAAKYTEETGVEIELKPIAGDAYPTQVSTQIQAGNAADLIIAPPGAGQAHSVVRLAEAGFLAPLGDASAAVVPEGTDALYSVDGKLYGQPTALTPNGLLWNAEGAEAAGIGAFPETFSELLEACTTAAGAGKTFTAIAGSVPANLGFLAQTMAASRVYATEPDWNEKRIAGEVTFADSEGWKQVVNDFKAMNDSGCFQAGAAGGGFDAITNGVSGGTALSAGIPGAAVPSLEGASGGSVTLDVHAFPGEEGEKPWVIASPLYSFVSNAGADESVQLAVQQFLDWVAEPVNSEQFASLAGSVPVAQSEDSELLAQYAPIATLIETNSYSPEPNLQWSNASVYDVLGSGLQGVLTGQKTPESVLSDMDREWK